MGSISEVPRLRELTERYRVCWDVWPELLVRDGKQRQVGFELELSGTHDFDGHHGGPDCPGCRQVFIALHGLWNTSCRLRAGHRGTKSVHTSRRCVFQPPGGIALT